MTSLPEFLSHNLVYFHNTLVTFTRTTGTTMLIILVLVTGMLAGLLPGLLKLEKMFSSASIAVGIIGAFVGAFLGFGDLPLFLEYSFLNEHTLMVAVSVLFVSIKILIARKGIAP